MRTMKAAVIYEAGGPEVLKIESRPIPTPQPGEVLIRVKAFGLNRSELFTRQGLSPGVVFPRVLGIEAVGLVEEAPGGSLTRGTSSLPPWAVWAAISTGAMRNIPACRLVRCR
jgi:NADPH:quinone reductase-like Zn-dependent oxidoreductase